MKQRKLKKESGFTLMEIIASLVILGILAIALSSAIMYGVGNLIYSRTADQLSQKAQLAMARLNRELVDVQAISVANDHQISYTWSDNSNYTILLANNQITLQGAGAAWPLIDGVVGNAAFTYFNANSGNWSVEPSNTINTLSQINVAITLSFQQSGKLTYNIPLSFNTTINPRNSNVPDAPNITAQ
jgi:prepilin-type N-terminal cleavage/methylation domain-containing protein